jgi:hypothetical protein
MTQVALLAARVLMIGVLAVSGAAKLADRPGTRRTVHAFGVRTRSPRPSLCSCLRWN